MSVLFLEYLPLIFSNSPPASPETNAIASPGDLAIAAFCPELFALRDKYWLEGDERYAELTDAIQYLGNISFRAPVPAYKHSCAIFQNLIGRCPSDLTHPKSATRPEWEKEILADCITRLR